jgi:hypothetical protein
MRQEPYRTPAFQSNVDSLCRFPLGVPSTRHQAALLQLLRDCPLLRPEFDREHRLIAITGTRRAYIALMLTAAAVR